MKNISLIISYLTLITTASFAGELYPFNDARKALSDVSPANLIEFSQEESRQIYNRIQAKEEMKELILQFVNKY